MFIKKVIILLMLILFIFSINSQPIQMKTLNDFEKIVQTIYRADRTAILTEWQVLGRETIQQSLDSIASELMDKHSTYAWNRSNEGVFGEKIDSRFGVKQQFKLLPVSEQKTMVLFVIYGKKVDKKVIDTIYQSIEAISITGNQKIFTCIKGFSDGNINRTYESMRCFLAAEVIEKTEEPGFISAACNSPFFNEQLTNKMNVQIACRQDDAMSRTEFTIGTPIITSEY